MAEEKGRSFILQPRFLLFCLYVMAYVCLRAYGEVVHETRAGTSLFGRRGADHVVGASAKVPRWRRQVYRIAFSPLMVAEEEGRRLGDAAVELVQQAGDYGKGLLE